MSCLEKVELGVREGDLSDVDLKAAKICEAELVIRSITYDLSKTFSPFSPCDQFGFNCEAELVIGTEMSITKPRGIVPKIGLVKQINK